MNKKLNLPSFTEEEIEEIETFKEITEAMSINEEEIICFSVLSDIINKKVELDTVPEEVLLKAYMQLKESNRICSELVWFDNTVIEATIPKAKTMISNILASRKAK